MVELTIYLKTRCVKANLNLDVRDLDFIQGCIFEWLGETDNYITQDGIFLLNELTKESND